MELQCSYSPSRQDLPQKLKDRHGLGLGPTLHPSAINTTPWPQPTGRALSAYRAKGPTPVHWFCTETAALAGRTLYCGMGRGWPMAEKLNKGCCLLTLVWMGLKGTEVGPGAPTAAAADASGRHSSRRRRHTSGNRDDGRTKNSAVHACKGAQFVACCNSERDAPTHIFHPSLQCRRCIDA